jgi:hypothetical protein
MKKFLSPWEQILKKWSLDNLTDSMHTVIEVLTVFTIEMFLSCDDVLIISTNLVALLDRLCVLCYLYA